MYKKDLYGKTIRKKIVFHGGFYMFGLIIALISGALMSIQGVFNTEVTKQSSTWTTSTFVQATGFLACLLIWLIADCAGPKLATLLITVKLLGVVLFVTGLIIFKWKS